LPKPVDKKKYKIYLEKADEFLDAAEYALTKDAITT